MGEFASAADLLALRAELKKELSELGRHQRHDAEEVHRTLQRQLEVELADVSGRLMTKLELAQAHRESETKELWNEVRQLRRKVTQAAGDAQRDASKLSPPSLGRSPSPGIPSPEQPRLVSLGASTS